MNEPKHRSPFVLVGRLIVLVKPMLPIMLAAIVMGVAGYFCATFITIFGGFGILRAVGLAGPALCRAGFQPLYRFQAAGPHPGSGVRRAAPLDPGQAGGP